MERLKFYRYTRIGILILGIVISPMMLMSSIQYKLVNLTIFSVFLLTGVLFNFLAIITNDLRMPVPMLFGKSSMTKNNIKELNGIHHYFPREKHHKINNYYFTDFIIIGFNRKRYFTAFYISIGDILIVTGLLLMFLI